MDSLLAKYTSSVKVRKFVASGTDSLGIPTGAWVDEETVCGVLVQPLNDTSDMDRPSETKAAFRVHFPSTYAARLRGKRVVIGGEEFAVVGDPRPLTASPAMWHMQADVERVDG